MHLVSLRSLPVDGAGSCLRFRPGFSQVSVGLLNQVRAAALHACTHVLLRLQEERSALPADSVPAGGASAGRALLLFPVSEPAVFLLPRVHLCPMSR